MGFQKIIPYKNPRHGAPGSIGSSTSKIEIVNRMLQGLNRIYFLNAHACCKNKQLPVFVAIIASKTIIFKPKMHEEENVIGVEHFEKTYWAVN